MLPRPPRATRTDTLFPYTTLFRSWSDLPFIVLTQGGGGPERNPGASRLSEALGSVTFLERPFHSSTFVSVARTALKGRLRQYEARARLEELREGEAPLRTALLAGRPGPRELDPATPTLAAPVACPAAFRTDERRGGHEWVST